MLALSSDIDGVAKSVKKYNEENGCQFNIVQEIFFLADDLADRYLEELDSLLHINDSTEEQLKSLSSEELLSYAGDALRCFVDERWEGSAGKNWQLMILDEINKRGGSDQ